MVGRMTQAAEKKDAESGTGFHSSSLKTFFLGLQPGSQAVWGPRLKNPLTPFLSRHLGSEVSIQLSSRVACPALMPGYSHTQ